MRDLFMAIYTLILGLCVGSFLNVVIYRLPMGRSIANPPRSVCPTCGTRLKARDNLPVVSYLWLRARCRYCHFPIHWRYPTVELGGGLAALAVWWRFGPDPAALVYFAFLALLLTVSLIDLDHRIIPDAVTLPAIPVAIVLTAALLPLTWRQSLFGCLLGIGSLWTVAWGYRRLTGKEGMGQGDVKLLGLIGAVIGIPGVLFTIFAASALGTLIGLAAMPQRRRGLKLAIPFGPFLAAGALLYLFWGPYLIRQYWRLLS